MCPTEEYLHDLYDVDRLTNLADLDIENCPWLDIPEWLHMYRMAANAISYKVGRGDFDGCTPNELVTLRIRILQHQRELAAVGKRHGFYIKSARWFVEEE